MGNEQLGSDSDLQRQVEHRLAGWRLLWPEVEVVARVVSGPVVTTLLLESDGAQLIVLGRHSGTRQPELRLGASCASLLQRSAGPMAVVPVLAQPEGVPSP